MVALRATGGVLLAVGLLAAGLRSAPRALAEGGAGTICLRPAMVNVAVGETATVEIWLEGGAGYYGVELRLACDPDLVRLPAGQVTPLWEVLDAERHVIVRNQAGWCDDRSGNVWYGVWYVVANVSPAAPFSGSGRICAIDLVGLAPGAAPLRITYAAGGTNRGGALAPGMAGAVVMVAEGAAATRTPPATATAMPIATVRATPTTTATATRHATLEPPTLAVTVVPTWAVATVTAEPQATALPAEAPPALAQQTQRPFGGLPMWRLLLAFLGGALGSGGLLRLLRRRR